MTEVRPFRVEISGAAIDDLRERLARTRWPEKEPVGDWSMGIPLAYVQELASYWAESYDMRRVADLLNRYEQFTTAIDGVDIHFLHVRSPVEGATPCIMTHGWPGSVIEFVKVIDPLVDPVAHGGDASDALELVIPSLPGYGWSGKPTVTGWTFEKIAQAWIELMDRLGYERWVAQGGDWGALVSQAIGRLADPATLLGIHYNWALADPAKLTELGGPTEEEQSYLARVQHSSEAEVGYAIEQGTKPQTLGYGLTDSPVGQLAWIVEKFKTWSDCGDDLESLFTKGRTARQRDDLLAERGGGLLGPPVLALAHVESEELRRGAHTERVLSLSRGQRRAVRAVGADSLHRSAVLWHA